MELQPVILAVDDDPICVKIISLTLEKEKYRVLTASSGREALELLKIYGHEVEVILLDLIMPDMDGMTTLKIIKEDPAIRDIPVVMQTVRTDTKDIIRGIKAGAFYYLTKPYDERIFILVVESARTHYMRFKTLMRKIEEGHKSSVLMNGASFRFKKPDEADNLAHWLANACPDPKNAILGLSELFENSIEHGNLGIDYEEKGVLLREKRFKAEVERRLNLPEYADKYVEVTFKKNEDEVRIHIKDKGNGFDFKRYLSLDKNRIFDNHGKGILMARMLYFDDISYLGCGNEVEAVAKYKRAPGMSG